MAVDRERRHQKHRQLVMARYEGMCHICNGPYADAIDHVVPVAKGGSDHPDNLRPAHTSCNSSKGARSYPSWADENPNMWVPGFEPQAVQRRRQKEAEAAERWRIEKEAEEELLTKWLRRTREDVETVIDKRLRLMRPLLTEAERLADLDRGRVRHVGYLEVTYDAEGKIALPKSFLNDYGAHPKRILSENERYLRKLLAQVIEENPECLPGEPPKTPILSDAGLSPLVGWRASLPLAVVGQHKCGAWIQFKGRTPGWNHDCLSRKSLTPDYRLVNGYFSVGELRSETS